jgi:MarR family transcriptional regulator, organic hydroperoxide resistance regulator
MKALQTCLALDQVHARLRRKLDDELGTRHGLSWADFVLLRSLSDSAGKTAAQLEVPLGVQRSGVIRQVLALEKTGLVARTGQGGARTISLRTPGKRLLHEAEDTANAVCAAALEQSGGAGPSDLIALLAGSPALELG